MYDARLSENIAPSAKVGFTVVDAWLAYAPVKNNPEDAAKVPKGNPYQSATSGEMAIYCANSLILRKAGVLVDDPVQEVFNGQEVDVWPCLTWKPKWGPTFSDIKSKVSRGCYVSQKSTMVIKGRNVFLEDLSLDGMVIKGRNVFLEDLSLDGALIIDSVDDAEVKVGGKVANKGWTLEHVDHKDTSIAEELRIRGFKVKKLEQLQNNYGEPSQFSLKP